MFSLFFSQLPSFPRPHFKEAVLFLTALVHLCKSHKARWACAYVLYQGLNLSLSLAFSFFKFLTLRHMNNLRENCFTLARVRLTVFTLFFCTFRVERKLKPQVVGTWVHPISSWGSYVCGKWKDLIRNQSCLLYSYWDTDIFWMHT